MGTTVDGLVSGMDTTAMIASMMQIEAAPQNLLKNKVSTQQTAVSSYQSVNTKLAALKSAADDLSQLSTWRSIKPTVSSANITATASGSVSTSTGSVTFDVVGLAKAQSNTARVPSAGDITSADSIQISMGAGDPVTIDISADKSAAGVALAINNAGISVKASLVQTSAGDSVLTLNGGKSGASNAFTLTGMDDVAMRTVTQASSAQIQVGGADEDGGYGLTSDTNTFTGLMAGVTMTVSKVESDVTLDSAPDVSGIAAKFAALVAAANGTLTEIGNQTAYDSGTNKGSPLTGDFTVRQMSQSILSAISGGLSFSDSPLDPATGVPIPGGTQVNFGSLSKLGIQLDKTGQLSFDADKFTAAYNADPSAIKKAGTAFGDQFEALATKQSAGIASTITSSGSQIDSLNLQITNWDVRLAAKQTALSTQYSNLETALGKLKDQSTWLSGQISSLS
jgi:flagellar hook-associated protein 2